MSDNGKSINLDVFGDVAGRVTVGGVDHVVKHLNGREYRQLQNINDMPTLDAYEIAARIVPTLDVYHLTDLQIGAVISIALGLVEKVEAMFPNADGAPATNESPAPPVSP